MGHLVKIGDHRSVSQIREFQCLDLYRIGHFGVLINQIKELAPSLPLWLGLLTWHSILIRSKSFLDDFLGYAASSAKAVRGCNNEPRCPAIWNSTSETRRMRLFRKRESGLDFQWTAFGLILCDTSRRAEEQWQRKGL